VILCLIFFSFFFSFIGVRSVHYLVLSSFCLVGVLFVAVDDDCIVLVVAFLKSFKYCYNNDKRLFDLRCDATSKKTRQIKNYNRNSAHGLTERIRT